MSADPTGTQSPHLDLGDLIAEASSQTIGAAARAHLADCEQCRLEASRWNVVADGVRSLAASASEAAAPDATAPGALPAAVPAIPADPVHPRDARRRPLKVPIRRALLVAGSAAAALVVLVAVGAAAGLVHVSLNGPSTSTNLMAVSGCPALEQASGTLEQVYGRTLVVKTAGGQSITVTTTSATLVSQTGALPADITNGATVTVGGRSSGGIVAASFVVIANLGQQHPQPPAGLALVKGTVADASSTGFIVVTSGGTRVPVTTSGETAVSVLNGSLGKLPAGASLLAVGYAGPNGTLSARGVVAISQLPPGGPQLHAQPHINTTTRVHVQDCSPASISHGLLLAAGG
jgi:hypothetical protein